MANSKKPEELHDSDLDGVTGGSLIDPFPIHFTGESKEGVVTEEITVKGEASPRNGTTDSSKIVASGGMNDI